MPATGERSGQPASSSASEAPQTEAIELLPLDSRISETTRMEYGNSSGVGMTMFTERSARLPWPISRRLVPTRRRTSPTEKGGKL